MKSSDDTGVLDHSKFGSLLVIVFGFFLTVCIAWCNGGKNAKYIKKNPLLMGPFQPIPVQKVVEMKLFVPKFIALSYRSKDHSNRSTEHIY
ncbi:hypothetical protein CAEBREN_17768 [Caenorhabditis brenneri]|uniref:Uncharacterized protein n=1 Tax=Caenorhabditis brenneri TaxID=135651 RepID=G0NQU9_CAEBE|nr:hypothetical protein CAEBREN_17768 [Caenorhabditis brenneri]